MVLDEGRTAAAVAVELGLAVSTVRRWVRAERERLRAEWWAAQVAPAFGFLSDMGFTLVEVIAAKWWEISAVYRADRAAVCVVYNIEFNGVEVTLMRASLLDLPDLDHGRSFVTGVPGLRGHLADRLLVGPYPDRKQRLKVIRSYTGLDPERVAAALAFWARMIQEHATSFLRGDMSIIDEWERGQESPQVTVHVPRSATPSQEAAAVAQTRAVLPGVELVVERYPIPPEELDRRLAGPRNLDSARW